MKTETVDSTILTLTTRRRTSGLALMATHHVLVTESLNHLIRILHNSPCHALIMQWFSLYKQTLKVKQIVTDFILNCEDASLLN